MAIRFEFGAPRKPVRGFFVVTDGFPSGKIRRSNLYTGKCGPEFHSQNYNLTRYTRDRSPDGHPPGYMLATAVP